LENLGGSSRITKNQGSCFVVGYHGRQRGHLPHNGSPELDPLAYRECRRGKQQSCATGHHDDAGQLSRQRDIAESHGDPPPDRTTWRRAT
jgi:hypothetical protein